FEQLDHLAIADLHVINQQFLLCRGNKLGQLFASIEWADQEARRLGFVRTPLEIGIKQFFRLLYEFFVAGNQGKAAASLRVYLRVVEGQQVKFLAIDDHHLAVIAHEVIGGAGNGHASFQKAHLQLAQVFFPSAIGKGDQCVYGNAPFDCIFERFFDFHTVKPEDYNLNALLCFFDGLDDWADAVSRLDKQFQLIQYLDSI